jgi:hypothetical protein
MKQKLTLFLLAIFTTVGAWAADITVSPSTGTYYTQAGVEINGSGWGPTWKSTAKAADKTTPLIVFTGVTGMNAGNADIYSNQSYTLQAPLGYTIVSYTFNGTATGDNITITPSGKSGTIISNGNNLATPLSVDVDAQSTTFALSSTNNNDHFTNLSLTVTVTADYVVTYSKGTGSYTTTGNYVNTWNSTATNPQVTFSVSGGANNIASSTGYIYSGANGCTYVLTAQAGYLITGYEIVGTAQTGAQTLTPAAGGSATSFATSGTTTLTVSGLSTASTTFQQSKPNTGIALSSFKIFLKKYPCSATYVISDASGVIYTSDPFVATPGETITSLPSSLQRDYCTYSVTPTTIASGENEVPVTLTAYNPPFTVSSDFATATWYYWNLHGSYVSYANSTPYPASTTKPTTDAGLWAFTGNPYGIKIINKAAGDTKYLQANSYPEMTTTATEWVIANNQNKGFTVHAGANNYLNLQSNSLRYWNDTRGATDNGSTFTVEEYSEEYAGDVATYITPYFQNHGNYFALKEAVYSDNEATWTAATSTCNKATYDALLAVVSNTSNLVWPETGCYLLRNHNSGTYLSTTTTPALSATTTTPATIVKLTNNGDGTYYIQSQGAYLTMSGSSVVLADTPAKFFVTLGTATKVSLTAEGSLTSSYNNITAQGGNISGYPARGITTDPYSYWSVEDAGTITVPLNGPIDTYYYATFCAPFSYTVSGPTAYTLKRNGNELDATSVDGAVPAGTPVLLMGTSASATLTISGTDYATSPLSSDLTGTYTAIANFDGSTNYVLGTDDTKVGFFHWRGTTLNANRAYVAGSGGEVKGFVLNFDDDETGIEGVQEVQEVQGAIYNLAGQRISKMQKGINIVNGKKVLK